MRKIYVFSRTEIANSLLRNKLIHVCFLLVSDEALLKRDKLWYLYSECLVILPKYRGKNKYSNVIDR